MRRVTNRRTNGQEPQVVMPYVNPLATDEGAVEHIGGLETVAKLQRQLPGTNRDLILNMKRQRGVLHRGSMRQAKGQRRRAHGYRADVRREVPEAPVVAR